MSFAQREAFVPKYQQAIAHDADGNLTSDGRWTYTWNSLNQLTGMTPTNTAKAVGHPGTRYQYSYDKDGWRTEKRISRTSTPERIRYIYYGNDLLAEVKVTVNSSGAVSSSTLTKGYHWQRGAAGEAWRLLSVQDYTRGTTALPGYDGRGNIVTWTNRATGELIGTADYGPYGELYDIWWTTDADKESYGSFGFGTEYRDETGLIYYGARYYSPALGRFISRDPAGIAGSGVNLYAFCGGDPVNNRELYGLCTGGGSYGNSGSFFSRAWNWLASSKVGQWVGGLFSGDTSDQSATPDSYTNDSAATNSGDSSSGSYHNGGAGWGSSGGYSGQGNITGIPEFYIPEDGIYGPIVDPQFVDDNGDLDTNALSDWTEQVVNEANHIIDKNNYDLDLPLAGYSNTCGTDCTIQMSREILRSLTGHVTTDELAQFAVNVGLAKTKHHVLIASDMGFAALLVNSYLEDKGNPTRYQVIDVNTVTDVWNTVKENSGSVIGISVNSSYGVQLDKYGNFSYSGAGHAISAIHYNEGSDLGGTYYISLGGGSNGVYYYQYRNLVNSQVLNPPHGEASSLNLRYQSGYKRRYTYFKPTQMLIPVPKK